MTPEIDAIEAHLGMEALTRLVDHDDDAYRSPAPGLIYTRAVGRSGAMNRSGYVRPMFEVLPMHGKGMVQIVGCPVCGDVQYPGRRCEVHDVDFRVKF